jgi:hypothetical protein
MPRAAHELHLRPGLIEDALLERARAVALHFVAANVEHAHEVAAHPDRPGKRRRRHAERRLDLVDELERRPHLAVELVDEGDDRRIARAAHLEKAQRLRLDPLGRIDHHQRRIHCGQHPVRVLGEVLVPRRVEEVDDAAAVLHLHHRARHGDPALLLDLHPVRGRVPRALPRLHRPGDMDRAGEKQQLLRQRGLARVRVGDDGKGSAPRDFPRDLRLAHWNTLRR